MFFFSLTYLKLNVEQINDVEAFLKLLHTKWFEEGEDSEEILHRDRSNQFNGLAITAKNVKFEKVWTNVGGIKINGMNIEKKEFHVLSKLIMQIANITIMKTDGIDYYLGIDVSNQWSKPFFSVLVLNIENCKMNCLTILKINKISRSILLW